MHVVGEVGECDLGLGALDADGADEQPHLLLLPSEDMFNAGTDLGLGGIASALGHWLAAGFLRSRQGYAYPVLSAACFFAWKRPPDIPVSSLL